MCRPRLRIRLAICVSAVLIPSGSSFSVANAAPSPAPAGGAGYYQPIDGVSIRAANLLDTIATSPAINATFYTEVGGAPLTIMVPAEASARLFSDRSPGAAHNAFRSEVTRRVRASLTQLDPATRKAAERTLGALETDPAAADNFLVLSVESSDRGANGLLASLPGLRRSPTPPSTRTPESVRIQVSAVRSVVAALAPKLQELEASTLRSLAAFTLETGDGTQLASFVTDLSLRESGLVTPELVPNHASSGLGLTAAEPKYGYLWGGNSGSFCTGGVLLPATNALISCHSIQMQAQWSSFEMSVLQFAQVP